MRWIGVGIAVGVVVWLARPDERARGERETTVLDEPVERAPRAAPEPAKENEPAAAERSLLVTVKTPEGVAKHGALLRFLGPDGEEIAQGPTDHAAPP